jgi:peptide deformylase
MILPIVKAPGARLKSVCAKADPSLAHHRTFARSLVETMKSHKAYGVAANQVTPGPLVRIIAISTKEFKGAMFNPEVVKQEGSIISEREKCLSLKDEFAVPRSSKVTVSFLDIFNNPRSITFEDFSSIVVQHEIDHLNGILASDYFDNAPETP